MKDVGELAMVAQEDVRQDLQAMFRGAIRASLELFLEAELEALVGAECASVPGQILATDDIDGLIRQTTRTVLDGMRVRQRRGA